MTWTHLTRDSPTKQISVARAVFAGFGGDRSVAGSGPGCHDVVAASSLAGREDADAGGTCGDRRATVDERADGARRRYRRWDDTRRVTVGEENDAKVRDPEGHRTKKGNTWSFARDVHSASRNRLTSSLPVAPLRRSAGGAFMPVTDWLLYAGHKVDPICRSLTVGNLMGAKKARNLAVTGLYGFRRTTLDFLLVPRKGIEPPCLAAAGPKPAASTNFATWAR